MLRADDARSEPSVYGDSVRDVNVWRTKMRKSSSGTLESMGSKHPHAMRLAQYAHATLHSLKQKPNPARRYREFTTLHGDAASLIPGTRSFQFNAPPPPTPPAPRILSLQFRHRPLSPSRRSCRRSPFPSLSSLYSPHASSAQSTCRKHSRERRRVHVLHERDLSSRRVPDGHTTAQR